MSVSNEWYYDKGELMVGGVGEKSTIPERWLKGGRVGEYVILSRLRRVMAAYVRGWWGVTINEAIFSEEVDDKRGVGDGDVTVGSASDLHAQVIDAGTCK
jgi:hypothetical protein